MNARPTTHPTRRGVLYLLLLSVFVAALGPMTGLYAQDAAADPAQDAALEAQPEAQPDAEPAAEEPVPDLTETLGGTERYLTHLATDKPIYREGETLYVRGTILHAFTQKPIQDNREQIEAINQQIRDFGQPENDEQRQALQALYQRRAELNRQARVNPTIEIKDPKGAVITTGMARVEDSVFGFSWKVPEGQAGGEYTVKVTHPWSGLAPAERTFDIRAYRAPRIQSQIQFRKDGYGPGDTVTATLEATRAEGGTPDGAKITAIARIDGAEVARVDTVMAASGTAQVSFELPGEIERGEGSLAFVIRDGGVVETASKTLPILLQTVDLALYPEGGDLVAGVENRVYFEAKTPYGKPADIKGVLSKRVQPEGPQFVGNPFWEFLDVEFTTTHEGRGVFSFTPKAGEQYALRILEPASVTQTFELPAVGNGSVALHFEQTVFDFDQPIRFKVSHSVGQPIELGFAGAYIQLRQREAIVAEGPVLFTANGFMDIKFLPVAADGQKPPAPVLEIPDSATGILTVTVYDEEGGKPLAERLIYRAPKGRVNVEIVADSARYTPSGKVQLTIKTTDQDGKPVSAVAGLTVTDDSVLEMIETREQAPMLPAMVLLEQEVQDLADAHVYLDPNNPDAAQQLDLLLGTQGWRRFALVNLDDFILEHGDNARRMLALRVPVKRELERVRRFAAAQANAPVLGVPAEEAAPGALLEADDAEDLQRQDEVLKAGDPGAPPPPAQAPPIQREQLEQALDEAERAREAIVAELDVAAARVAFPQMVFIREYAHAQPAGKPFGQRSDFTETVYWSAATKTNDAGIATITFDLSDSVTSFRVKADAFTKDGALGANSELIESVRPFYVEPKLPLEITEGDEVHLPIALINNTASDFGAVSLMFSKLEGIGKNELELDQLQAGVRDRVLYGFKAGKTYGDLAFNITARTGNFFDENKRKIRVVPKGFPIDDGSGGMLNPNSEVKDEITIPETIVPGSLSATVTVYPTPLANLTEALEALIRDPYGCFEQTSSTTFPLVMAQQYFMSHTGVDPALIARSQEKLDKGYQRLIGFETEQNGYEWFGNTPPHESLTAYGLLQFNEMKQVMDVDQQMIDRTADWLMSRRDGEGSFKLDPKNLDSFGAAPQDTTNAYIVWSLLEAGYSPEKIMKEIDAVLKQAMEGEDAYIIALGANIAQLAADSMTVLRREGDEVDPSELQRNEYEADAIMLREKLAKKLSDEGFVEGAVTSITRSGGDALRIETTSLAILAWLRDDAYTEQVEQSILWLTERCKGGRFGSTQSTVLALKAIVEYDKARSTPKAPGSLQLLVNGEPVGEPVVFDEETRGAIKLPSAAPLLKPGKHTVALKMTGGSKMPYAIAIDYFANTPASSDDCKLRIETALATDVELRDVAGDPAGKKDPSAGLERVLSSIREGESTEINVKVTNTTKDGLPTPIAIVGIPGGLEPSFDQLKELVEAGTIAAFEVIGRDVVLYWREMRPEQVVELSIRCTAAIPGTYTGPASRAYLYYTDEHKHWVDGLTVTITARTGE